MTKKLKTKTVNAWAVVKNGRIIDWCHEESQGIGIVRTKRTANEVCYDERRIFMDEEIAKEKIKVIPCKITYKI